MGGGHTHISALQRARRETYRRFFQQMNNAVEGSDMAKAEKISPWKGVVTDDSGAVKLSGEIDFTNSQLVRDWMVETFTRTQGEVRVDMTDVDYIDSSGLAVLIELRKALKAKGRSIKITSASLQVHKLFSLTQIGDLFGI